MLRVIDVARDTCQIAAVSTYAVGDIQGCFAPLQRALEQVGFRPGTDKLWCVGDLVNRGPQSLETLRFLRDLGDDATCVLGNHDLHFLAVALGTRPPRTKDTLGELLTAPDCAELVTWLRCRPLFHRDETLGYAMVHAGIAPDWSLDTAARLAREVEAVLQGPEVERYLDGMYGGEPDRFSEGLRGTARWRVITNVLTRIRYVRQDGSLQLSSKGHPSEAPAGLIPWFQYPTRVPLTTRLLFGHWATLNAEIDRTDLIALDTGCVWGRSLSVYRLEDGVRTQCACR